MALIADSGGIYARYDSSDRNHRAVRQAVETESGPLILPPPVLGEINYLLQVRIGIDAGIRLLEGVEIGALAVEPFTRHDAARCRALLAKYRELDLGLADASVIAIAERLGVRRILTVDERDFRAVRSKDGEAFVLVLWDERLSAGGESRLRRDVSLVPDCEP